MKNAQEWLNETYPTKNQREEVRKIFIDRKEEESFPKLQLFSDNSENNHYLAVKLEKKLDLSDFVNLEMLFIEGQKITELKISNCSKLSYLNCSNNELKSLNLNNLTNLETIICSNNFLTELDLSSQNSEKLSSLHIGNNNFSGCDLSNFSRFTKLCSLYLGTDNRERIKRNIYNRFFGSLEDLKNLTVLTELDINATDIDDGLEYLPTKELYSFCCASKREGAGVEKIKKVLGLSEKLAEEEGDEESEEKIDRIKIFRRYF
jgi:Leucine-rich repeat (LRR) protein